MSAPQRRRFTVMDAVIAVAAVAVGLALVRGEASIAKMPDGVWSDEGPTALEWVTLGLRACVALEPLLLAAAGAVVVMRLRSPRPRLRRVARQPGFVLCVTPGVYLAALALGNAASWAWARLLFGVPPAAPDPVELNPLGRLEALPTVFGALILTVAVMMALGRAFRPEASWVDRGGRAVAALIVANAVACELAYRGVV